jgi:hypothetical protein
MAVAAAAMFAAAGACLAEAPTAHAPQYSDPTAWPAKLETAKAPYAKEQWPAATVLVWARTVAAGAKVAQQIDDTGIDDPANWKNIDGSPAKAGPDSGADVVFPEGAKVSFKTQLRARHVTLAPGSSVAFADLALSGNLWIQKGATFQFVHGTLGAADKDTFVRSDNPRTERFLNFLRYRKRPEKGTELIGKWQIGDQVFLYSGHFIIAPGSTFQHTDRFPLDVYPDGTLEILSGATYEARGNYYHKDDVTIHGKLLAGTADRPLTADATMGLSFKAHGKGKDSGSNAVKASTKDDVGLLLMPKAELTVTSSDPAKARLVFRWHRNPQATFAWGADRREGPAKGDEPADLAAMPHGICMRFFGQANLNGVVFDDVLRGGIALPDPAVAKQWKNVTIGKGSFGQTLDDLVSPWKGPVPTPRQTPAPAKPQSQPAKG